MANLLMQQFQNAAPPPAPQGAPAGYPPPAAPAVSVYDSTDTGQDRFPRPAPGTYRFKVKQSGEQQMTSANGYRGDPYFFVDLEVVQVLSGGKAFRSQDADTVVGSVIHYDQCVSDRAASAAAPRINRLFVSLFGAPDIATLNAMFPGIKLAAAGRAVNMPNGQPYPVNPLKDLEVIGTVSLGDICSVKDPTNPRNRIPDPQGDRYRDYAWSPAPQAVAG